MEEEEQVFGALVAFVEEGCRVEQVCVVVADFAGSICSLDLVPSSFRRDFEVFFGRLDSVCIIVV